MGLRLATRSGVRSRYGLVWTAVFQSAFLGSTLLAQFSAGNQTQDASAARRRENRYPRPRTFYDPEVPQTRAWSTPAANLGFLEGGRRYVASAPGNSLVTRYAPSGARMGRTADPRYRLMPQRGWNAVDPRSFRSFGGFGERRSAAPDGDPATALARKRLLIGATAGNAPIYRAYLQNFSILGTRQSLSRTPFSTEVPETLLEEQALSDALKRNLGDKVETIREKAFEAFGERDYRAAARSFDTVAALDADDWEARLAGVFSYASLGALRTAASTVRDLNRRDPSLFLHDVQPAKWYASPDDLRQVRVQARTIAQSSTSDQHAWATAALVLWYLGDRPEAMTAAGRLARAEDESDFADWIFKMRAAEASRTASPESR